MLGAIETAMATGHSVVESGDHGQLPAITKESATYVTFQHHGMYMPPLTCRVSPVM